MSAITLLLRVTRNCMKNTFDIDLRPSLERQKYNQEERRRRQSIAKSGYPNIIHFPSLLSYRRWSLCRRIHVLCVITFVRTIASRECGGTLKRKISCSRLFMSYPESRNSQSLIVLQTSPPYVIQTCSSPILSHRRPAQSPAKSTAQLPD